MQICKIEGCDLPVKVVSRRLCHNHYMSLIRKTTVPLLVNRPIKLCQAPGCENKNYMHGLCQRCLGRMRHHGTTDLSPRIPKQPDPCKIAGCPRPAAVHGWCKSHNARHWTTGQVGDALIKAQKPDGYVGYGQARRVLNQIRGKAKEHLCVECPKTATRWTLCADAPVLRETVGQYRGLPFSDNPWQYDPRCAKHATRHNEDHGFVRSQ